LEFAAGTRLGIASGTSQPFETCLTSSQCSSSLNNDLVLAFIEMQLSNTLNTVMSRRLPVFFSEGVLIL
jgi:hypothetical protein